MRRTFPWWLRLAAAVITVVVLWWPYAGWHWHESVATGRGVWAVSPTGRAVFNESVLSLFTDKVVKLIGRRFRNRVTWHLSYAVATSVPAAMVAVFAFSAFTRWLGPAPEPDPHTRCRRCHYILFGLTEARCPECGERI